MTPSRALLAAAALAASAAVAAARATQVQVTSGTLAGNAFTGVLEEDLGKVAFHEVDSIQGEAVYVERTGDSCTDLGSGSLKGKVAMLLLEEICDALIADMANTLADRGAVAVVLNAHECMCDALDSGAVKASADWCSASSCLTYLQPRGSPQADTLSVPLLTMSLEDFGAITDCLGDTDFVDAPATQGACADAAPTVELSWDFTQTANGDLEIEMVSEIGADITVSPFKTLAFIDGVLEIIDGSVGTWVMRPPILNGSAIERDCTTCTSDSKIVDCTDPPSDLQSLCDGICINEGRYCQPSVTLDSSGTYTIPGASIVEESLRQICLLEQVGTDASKLKSYFTYLRDIELSCLTSGSSLTSTCSAARQSANGFDSSVTDSCVSSSGTTGENSLLEPIMRTPAEYIEDLDIIKAPTFRVNQVTIPFGNSWGNILSAMCASISGSRPGYCSCIYNSGSSQLYSDENLLSTCFGVAGSGSETASENDAARKGLIAGLTIALVVLFLAVGYVGYRRFYSPSAAVAREQELQDFGVDQGATGATSRSALARCFGRGNATGANAQYPTKTVAHI